MSGFVQNLTQNYVKIREYLKSHDFFSECVKKRDALRSFLIVIVRGETENLTEYVIKNYNF